MRTLNCLCWKSDSYILKGLADAYILTCSWCSCYCKCMDEKLFTTFKGIEVWSYMYVRKIVSKQVSMINMFMINLHVRESFYVDDLLNNWFNLRYLLGLIIFSW